MYKFDDRQIPQKWYIFSRVTTGYHQQVCCDMIAHNKSHWKQSCVVIGYLAGDFGTDGESVRDDWFFVCGLAIPAVQLNTATAAQQHLAIDLHRRLACELVTFRHTDIQTAYLHSYRQTDNQTPAYRSPPTTCLWTGDLWTHTNMNMSCHAMNIKWCEQVVILITKFNSGKQSFINTG